MTCPIKYTSRGLSSYDNARIHGDPSATLQSSMTLFRGKPPKPPKAKAKA